MSSKQLSDFKLTIDSDITSDTTWTKAGSPYIVTSDVTVKADVALTVDPDVEVRFQHHVDLTVQGRLTALGTASQPITFTGTTQQSSWWGGLSFQGTVQAPIGGIVQDVLVPKATNFDGQLHVYLPEVVR